MVVISFVCLQKINNFPKFGRCGSKIEPATPIWNLKLDWAWQAQFLSHIHEFLQNYLFFKDLQMILVSFFEIFDGFWSTKKLPSLLLHVIQDLLELGHQRCPLTHDWPIDLSDWPGQPQTQQIRTKITYISIY